MVRTFQSVTRALRLADVPVVSCPAGLTLGGGCEVAMHTHRVQAAAETYFGLVEAGVGLIPAAGGTKEMIARAVESLAPGDDLLPAAQRVFETIGFAKVSTSAPHAQELGYLRSVDAWTMNREQVMADAKTVALDLADRGYRAPDARTSISVGGDDVRAALNLGVHLAWRAGRITDHEALIGRTLAHVIAGGSLAHRASVGEQYLLDLEREAFLKLCGERKTLERIQHTLKTGKTLRN
jgi:3-hydroxyacyl-CoA dehydrogenase